MDTTLLILLILLTGVSVYLLSEVRNLKSSINNNKPTYTKEDILKSVSKLNNEYYDNFTKQFEKERVVTKEYVDKIVSIMDTNITKFKKEVTRELKDRATEISTEQQGYTNKCIRDLNDKFFRVVNLDTKK